MFRKIVVGSGLFGILVCLAIFGSCEKATAPDLVTVQMAQDEAGANVVLYRVRPFQMDEGLPVSTYIKIDGTDQFIGLVVFEGSPNRTIIVPVCPQLPHGNLGDVDLQVGQTYFATDVYCELTVKAIRGNYADIDIWVPDQTVLKVKDVPTDELRRTLSREFGI